jgi:hypothetical protein
MSLDDKNQTSIVLGHVGKMNQAVQKYHSSGK